MTLQVFMSINILLGLFNFLLCWHLNNTLSFIMNPYFGSEYYMVFIILTSGFAANAYFFSFKDFYNIITLCIRIFLIPINLITFFILL